MKKYKSLSEIVSDQSRVCGDACAVIDPKGEELSYSQLEDRVGLLGTFLNDRGFGHHDLVGIMVPKSDVSVISILGVLKASAVYVPADADGAMSRNALIFSDCLVSAILVAVELIESIQDSLSCDVEIYDTPEQKVKLLVCIWPDSSIIDHADDLAMVLYTSGSTGVPKGVQLTHENALTFIDWCRATFSLDEQDTCASIAPFHFDLSLFDLYVSFSAGATLLLLDQKSCQNPLLVSSYFDKYKITTCYTTPTLLNMLLQYGRIHKADHSSLKRVLFAGEVFPIKPLRELKSYWTQAEFYNLYGPTESNVITWHPIPHSIDENIEHPFPIGLPCNHATCKVLVDDGVVEIRHGVEGELIVTGPSVTPGYFNNQEKTSEVFIRGDDGRQYYRTGDFVSVDENDNIQFEMRKDRMVKRRGYRLELAEIERVLSFHENILEVAVSTSIKEGDLQLIAFISQNTDLHTVSSIDLKQYFLKHLPSYFLPDKFINVVVLPKTSTHKIDYQALSKLL